MNTLNEWSLVTLMFVQQFNSKVTVQNTNTTLCLISQLYDLVGQVTVIVQIKESLEIEDEFVFLELRESSAILALFENLNISHAADLLAGWLQGWLWLWRLLCSLTPVQCGVCLLSPLSCVIVSFSSLRLGGGQLSPLLSPAAPSLSNLVTFNTQNINI